MSQPNPWLPAPAPAPAAPAPAPAVVWSPGTVTGVHASGRRLPVREVEQAGLWVTGAHGGAGATTLARLLGAGDCGASWPHLSGGMVQVLVAARTNSAGIEAARDAAVGWAAGQAPGARLLAVVWMADAPGRLPRPLREALAMASGAYPASVMVPWTPRWRLAPAWSQPIPREISRALHAVPGYRKEDQ